MYIHGLIFKKRKKMCQLKEIDIFERELPICIANATRTNLINPTHLFNKVISVKWFLNQLVACRKIQVKRGNSKYGRNY